MKYQVRLMGSLYKNVGVDTSPELVSRRLEAAQKVVPECTPERARVLARIIFGLQVRAEETEWFTSEFRENDPLFDPVNDANEVRLLATALSEEILGHKNDAALILALSILTGAFLGERRVQLYPELVELAVSKLAELQVVGADSQSKGTFQKKPDLSEHLKLIEQHGPNNQFNNSWSAIRDSISAVNNQVEKGDAHLAQQISAFIKRLQYLEEQVEMQWWAIGGWSRDEGKPYAKMKVGEAAIRAGKELADLTESDSGVYAAPALLAMVIESGRKADALASGISLTDFVSSVPVAWRGTVENGITSSNSSPLFPVVLAISLSAESHDAPDWVPRFTRLTGLDPAEKKLPLELAVQLYRERLLWRSIV